MLASDILSEIKRLELRSRRRIDTDLMGGYQSAFRGSGLTFHDLREYAPGDETRHIHWKASARSGKTFVKSYTEDRELRVMLLVDVSRSLGFKDYRQRAAFLSAAISMLALANQDTVGLVTFGESVKKYFPPKRGRHHVQSIIGEILSSQAHAPSSNLAGALQYIRQLIRRSSIICIISDFYCPPFAPELQRLASRHDVICCLIGSAPELNLPPGLMLELSDAEGGDRVLIDSRRAGDILKNESLRREKLKTLVENAGGDLIEFPSMSLKPLRNLMAQRSKRFR